MNSDCMEGGAHYFDPETGLGTGVGEFLSPSRPSIGKFHTSVWLTSLLLYH